MVQAAGAGDLRRRVSVSGDDAIGMMGDGLRDLLGSLHEVVAEVAENVGLVATASGSLRDLSGRLEGAAAVARDQAGVASAASEQLAGNVHSVAAAATQVNLAVGEIARSASEASSIAANAVSVAKDTTAVVQRLDTNSKTVDGVIRVITSIAGQTRLLALNATIEAAHAGEAGRGFAVVAQEVKLLASQTAQATEESSSQLTAIRWDSGLVVEAIAAISAIIEEIDQLQAAIASSVEEQPATTTDISRNVSEAAEGVREIARIAADVAGSASSTTAEANLCRVEAGELAALSARRSARLEALLGRFRL